MAETPEDLLDDETTPVSRFFIRNNGLLPEPARDPEAWTFVVDGEVEREPRSRVADLKSAFAIKTFRMVLECGGNGRSFFEPQAEGNPWTNGGVGCAEWTGVSLADVLAAAGLKPSASHTAHYGADPDKNGDAGPSRRSRAAMPLAKAMEPHTLLAFGMNGEALPFLHGGPLRLVVPGWPGSLSQKWLTRIWIRDREHDGPGMTGLSYRVPVGRSRRAQDAAGMALRVLESMPVRSIVSFPADGRRAIRAGTRTIEVRGAAWAGDDEVARRRRDDRRRRDLDRGDAHAAAQSLRLDAVGGRRARCRATAITKSTPGRRTARGQRAAIPRRELESATATAATSCTGWRSRSGRRPARCGTAEAVRAGGGHVSGGSFPCARKAPSRPDFGGSRQGHVHR